MRTCFPVDDPLQAAGVSVEFGGDAGQCDIDDRDVEVDGQDRNVDRGQNSRLATHDDLPRVLVAAVVPMAIYSAS